MLHRKLLTYVVDLGARSLLLRPEESRRPNDTQCGRRGFLIAVGLASITLLTQATQAGSLTFGANVPNPPPELPVLNLTAQPAPQHLMKRLVTSTAASSGSAQLTRLNDTPLLQQNKVKLPEEVVGIVENNHVKAWANLRTGDAEIYPTLATAKEPISQLAASSLALRSQEIFTDPEFIRPDDTKVVIDQPKVLQGATFVRDAGGGIHPEKATTPYYVYVSARRFVSGLPVVGPGSRALLTISSGGVVEGMTRIWKTAKALNKVHPSLNAQQVQDEITRQLQPFLKGADAVVDGIGLAYYDANGAFLQPVYRFTVRVHPEAGSNASTPADEFLIGYVPFATALEPLPSLGSSGAASSNAVSRPVPKVLAPQSSGLFSSTSPISVGMYVVRNDDAGWVNDANAFWNALSSTQPGLFSLSQYYWAYPFEFTTQKDAYVNSVNLALTEVHGDWWYFTTYQNWGEGVSLWDIPYPGYGPSANGYLANWVLHSCEVVPTPDDTADWVGPWFTIFGGLRHVVGYRTIMYINDGAGGPYGTSLASLAPVISSWLSDVMSLNDYAGHPTAAAHGGIVRPMGRASAISMSGHENDTVLDVSWLPRATNLTVWWFPD
jgi:Family of unknown function (DUF6345)